MARTKEAPDTATVVRIEGDVAVLTDGPFAESKEHIGGVWIVEVAALVRQFRSIDLAEESVQDAFVIALQRWPADGRPTNPGARITVTAATARSTSSAASPPGTPVRSKP